MAKIELTKAFLKDYKEKQTCFVPTEEDWYPTENGQLRVSYIPLTDGMFRVCVWGADDFGMEKDMKDKGEARLLYRKIIKKPIKRKDLEKLGFVSA